MNELAPWLTTAQVAQLCGVDRAEAYHRLVPQLDFRRIGVRGGVSPWGRLIRVERGSVLRLCGRPEIPAAVLPRWVTPKQAGEHYQVSQHLIRRMIAYEQLDARRIGSSRTIRLDRGSVLALGRIHIWRPS
ncbi:DNA-binding protein [Mycobacterium sp. 236(2023)]|uniref:DNA-binding protein n=1 Tax=Mycobacterium sp. 236(2023) TaxID=3038163 RepID=UPI0024153D1F|nr:DNA-binding protein [Mycobacterium sp. 236(2023)]MDG4668640.1 DNA-binding protein [Mycobacterium sp. 236(2023)]